MTTCVGTTRWLSAAVLRGVHAELLLALDGIAMGELVNSERTMAYRGFEWRIEAL